MSIPFNDEIENDENGNNQLIRAIYNRDVEEVSNLIHQEEVNIINLAGETAMSLAFDSENREIIQIILDNIDRFDIEKNIFAINDATELIKEVDLKRTAIDILYYYGYDIDPPGNEYTPLVMAVMNEDLHSFNQLMNYNANPEKLRDNKDTRFVFDSANDFKDRLIEDKKFIPLNPDLLLQQGSTNLMFAASLNPRLLYSWIPRSKSINYQNVDGLTVVHYVVSLGNPILLDLLLQHHADLTIKNQAGYSPLDYIQHSILPQMILWRNKYNLSLLTKSRRDPRSYLHYFPNDIITFTNPYIWDNI